MANNLIIFELLKPKFLNKIFSFCSINFKKRIGSNQKYKWKYFKKIDGTFKKVKKIGSPIETSKSLKINFFKNIL